ncbi:MAG: ATP-binding cassette domain-containing protein [Cyclobacteriaceae bacterium]|nr:ATP-binding cassette domain-containing protein [Cyclobacteriaceae bacterium]MCB0499598.1 ATP-binding cassette domain-containing protein [Cyclobacteriaceae bacterium]MCB9239474.1 ATP-binding cassette domain-containing protein [Flammeovirgaceae bacterium]MCW5902652.1 ATP-binding cassette domain-containing protein [Cyclobacteriaceae bacterium]
MSEEILKALTQLFAIITKQDGGVTVNERQYVIRFFQQELDHDSIQAYLDRYDKYSGYSEEGPVQKETIAAPSVKDSIVTLGICKKINRTLTQKQKVIVLIKLLELVGADNKFTPQRMEIINTVSTVFNISAREHKLIETYVVTTDMSELDFGEILVVNAQPGKAAKNQKHIQTEIDGNLFFMHVPSVDLYFAQYLGDESHYLNGFVMQRNRIYLFSHGSTIKVQSGAALYYSDIVADFNEELQTTRLSFNARIEEYRFPSGAVGLRDIVVSEGPGKLIGIMGASGAGKTTLLNVLAGLEKPTKGEILINGYNIHARPDKINGVVGYVSQDDLLIEELTVFENLYYNAKLCFAHLSHPEVNDRVHKVLENLGLETRKDLKVGSVLDKKISGGQRKRLNIALELIREPAILFLDEPTSGLSSRDSENVIDLLKELSLKGKLVFAIVHQPSSDIYKMFDKMIIMDTGGYAAYYGTPVEAVSYFKRATHQAHSNRGQCETCGNVNPEQIFNIIDAKVVDEYGQPTNKRKVTPMQWHTMFKGKFKISPLANEKGDPPQSLHIPGRARQAVIFAARDLRAKISNQQYLLINLLEAPLLALILSLIIKYKSAPGGEGYIFRFNENFPAFLLMSIIVALFMGLTVSAEEIIRDRKILKRESFLNLSWNSYLVSKLGILFLLSAIQTLMFVWVGNLVLEIKGMVLAFWFILFSTSCMANVLGLNISSAFNSAVTVYVLIPLLLIPQMILSGVLFSFDKLHPLISNKEKVPFVADLMASRWAYEAMAVHQFVNNDYERLFYPYEKEASMADFKAAYVAEELLKRNQFLQSHYQDGNDSIKKQVHHSLEILKNGLKDEPYTEGLDGTGPLAHLTTEGYTREFGAQLEKYLYQYRKHYQTVYNEQVKTADLKRAFFEKQGYDLNEEKNNYYNQSLADLVKNVNTKERLAIQDDRLVQLIDPVFQSPRPLHPLDYRTAFFFPKKGFLGILFPTYAFNSLAIWLMTIALYMMLYFELLRKLLNPPKRHHL